MKKTAGLLSILIVLATLLQCACADVRVTDMKGREIVLPAPAARVVALTAADCEILFALGSGDALVGRGAYCNYPEEVLAVPSVESGYDTNIEQVIALAPQAVLMNTMAQSLAHVEALEAAGIAVVASTAEDIAGVYEAIAVIGALTGRDEAARELVLAMQADFAALAAGAPDMSGKTVYFEVSPLRWGLWTAGAGTFMDEIAGMLGLTNAFADVTGWAEISQEQVIARDPDYIVTIEGYSGEGMTPVEEIMARSGWQDMRAVKAGNVLNADGDEISRPGPRLVNAARALLAFIAK